MARSRTSRFNLTLHMNDKLRDADIDRDDTLELVFGTSDGYFHCWELGSCSRGYAPWPQFQHDEGRTGVLE